MIINLNEAVLARGLQLGYTACMHTIDRKWSGLTQGYQAVKACQARLEAEFGRAVQAGRRREFRAELTAWQKKRRIFFALAAIAPLSVIILCLTAFYFREVACVIVYWALLVLVILVTLAVALRQYIREMVAGKPVPQAPPGEGIDLEARWWQSLASAGPAVAEVKKAQAQDLITLLARSLPDDTLACQVSEGETLVAGPSGIWLFAEAKWSGRIEKQEGAWKQVRSGGGRLFRKAQGYEVLQPNPDDRWLELKKELLARIEQALPYRVWIRAYIQGGVAFTHLKARPEKKRIIGSTASYGPARAWAERIRRAPLVEGLTLEMSLEVLELFAGAAGGETSSAMEQVERLCREARADLRASVARQVG